MKKLPIGIQTFSKLRDDNCVYIDKTEQIFRMLTEGRQYFLSRPRRFGKSLTVSTIKSIFEGEKQYFANLWIDTRWDWSKRNPVLHLPFASLDYIGLGLEDALKTYCVRQAEKFEIVLESSHYVGIFEELIKKIYEKFGRVVILIDEYDKPIIDFLEKENLSSAVQNRQVLRNFYSIIKDADPFLEFFLMTGVSKFSQTGIFSHLNHLDDITTNNEYADLMGYTQKELEFYFEEYIEDSLKSFQDFNKQELIQNIKIWYNGYSWNGVMTVYNPYSVLLFFKNKTFENHWFKTGTPTFLLNLIKEKHSYNFNQIRTNATLVSSYELENLDIRTILFQTGYLTIKEFNIYNGDCVLDYPNREVEQSMGDYILALMTGKMPLDIPAPIQDLRRAFQEFKIEKVIAIINSMLRDIPSNLLKGKKEDFYHALVHLLFRYLGFELESEVHTSDGRMDAVVKTSECIYIIEFKINQSAETALQQIKDKKYTDKYLIENRKIVMLGINFDGRKKAVKDWIMEELD